MDHSPRPNRRHTAQNTQRTPQRSGGGRRPARPVRGAAPVVEPTFPMRLNKYLAWKKCSTRRGADEIIDRGHVTINGRVANLGDKVEMNDVVEVRRTGKETELVYYAYNKPRGVITHSPGPRETEIADLVKLPGVFPLGRLDKDSSGLIILTNDGRVTERLLHPRFEHEKEYIVTTKEPLRASFKQRMEAGVRIEREQTKPCTVTIMGARKFRVVLTEGKKHQIRRMCVALFQEVDTLMRVRIMDVKLGDLKEGALRKLEGTEKERFLASLGLLPAACA